MNSLTRRTILAGLVLAATLVAGLTGASALERTLSAAEAHTRAGAGEIVLVDIRDPTEWKETGIGATAQAISMHKPGFLEKLEKAVGGDKTKPIALICATGSRSAWLQRQLPRFGYKSIIDVSEGMLGGRAGKGWLKEGLPVKAVSE